MLDHTAGLLEATWVAEPASRGARLVVHDEASRLAPASVVVDLAAAEQLRSGHLHIPSALLNETLRAEGDPATAGRLLLALAIIPVTRRLGDEVPPHLCALASLDAPFATVASSTPLRAALGDQQAMLAGDLLAALPAGLRRVEVAILLDNHLRGQLNSSRLVLLLCALAEAGHRRLYPNPPPNLTIEGML